MNYAELTLKELWKLSQQVTWEIMTRLWWLYAIIIGVSILGIILNIINRYRGKRN